MQFTYGVQRVEVNPLASCQMFNSELREDAKKWLVFTLFYLVEMQQTTWQLNLLFT